MRKVDSFESYKIRQQLYKGYIYVTDMHIEAPLKLYTPCNCPRFTSKLITYLLEGYILNITSGKNFIKITSVGMGAAKSNETR